MTAEPLAFHRRVAQEKRAAIIEAATRLFLERGYDGTSLARVAETADVSKSTLFKQFPTKSALFEAIVTTYWDLGEGMTAQPAAGDLRAGLGAIGRQYAELLDRPGMASLFRIVIAELPRFPELGRVQFRLGKMPYFESVQRYLEAESAAGTASVDDSETAANQFLGMISNYVLWPRMLLVDWNPGTVAIQGAVDQAVVTMLARYSAATSN
ncbi:TetR/AcrR family transcriptional regulator [Streptomyces sp. NPDC048484]|uniref:TetR/AcrR family transcriptional regulator n=1 Tax=Streptomyces sp. NPDC048484 TaxID=3155146 RepID=UPI003441E66A